MQSRTEPTPPVRGPWSSRSTPAIQAAVAVGLPLAAFALAGDVQAGALATLGAMAALYAHNLPFALRGRRVALVGAALVLCALAGTVAAGSSLASVAVIAVVAGTAAFLSRRHSVRPPGALMPVLVCATATQIPVAAVGLAPRLGLVALGAALAWVVVMAGATFRRRIPTRPPATPAPAPSTAHVWRAAVRVSSGTAAAALAALALGLPRPDWAAATCAAVLVHEGTRATVRRVRDRAVGTAAGIAVAGAALVADLGTFPLVVLVVALQFVVELVVARNYTLAVALITPLALLQGALATGALAGPATALLTARLVETAVGCTLALLAQAACPPPGEAPVTRMAQLVVGRRPPVLA